MTDLFPRSQMRTLLEVDSNHVKDMLTNIGVHHRLARSLDFLGTALKVVAGTPDASDLENIRITEAKLVQSNNRQISINTKIQGQFNTLTDTLNKILSMERKEHINTAHLYETIS